MHLYKIQELIRLIIICTFIAISAVCFGQEICDNGIDDDGDGLIDLNDDECECSTFLPSSLIPNPSFEERTCCPMMNARLDCAVGWIQASAPTTDYVHTCGNYLGNTSIPAFAPLPFPDGEGAVGFRDGQKDVGSNYKEYVGACLTESMEVGVSYRLQFFVGFRDNVQGNKHVQIAIFGSEFCSRLPFGNNSISIGCPANTGHYDEIDTKSVSGTNEWVSVDFEFVPTKPYDVIVIGPHCSANPNFIFDPYFYLDGLTLAETAEFGVPLDEVEGSICNDDLVLSIEDEAGQSYQWYKDGVALPGENSPELSLVTSPDVEGEYLVVINFPDGCISSKSYNVRVPPYYADQEATICENDEYYIENTPFTESGVHEITIAAHDGCDSIITLTLNVDPNTTSHIDDIFCEGEEYSLLDITANQAGTYQTTLTNIHGCDSTIFLNLTEIPMTSGFDLPSDLEIVLGESISVTPTAYDPLLIDFTWYDETGQFLGNNLTSNIITPIENTTLTLEGRDEYGCAIQSSVLIRIDKSSTVIHVPNIFSPDDNGINDFFTYVATAAVQSIDEMTIYDRWGNLIYKAQPLLNFANHEGWDGTFNGRDVAQGVYAYKVSATFIDGTSKDFTGDLTLIRLQ